MRQAGFAAFPTEEHPVKRGEQPCLDLGLVAELMALASEPAERFLRQLAGIVAVASETEREGKQALVISLDRKFDVHAHGE